MFSLKTVAPVLLGSLLIALPSLGLAQFQPSQAKLFVDWPELQMDPMPGQQTEAAVYAIVDLPTALYTISVTTRSGVAVLGAFQCNKEFSVLKSGINGFYDIRCVDEDIFENSSTYVLRYGKNGRYNQIF